MIIDPIKVKHIRVSKGWTQQHLADLMGVSLRTIQRIEKTGQTSLETISAFCAVFEVERNDIALVPNIGKEELKPAKQYNILFLSVVVFIFGVAVGAVFTLIANN